LIKDKEVEMGGSTPRILNIDGEIILLVWILKHVSYGLIFLDYFMVEHDEVETCLETGQKRNVKKMVYEYEKEMEPSYMQCEYDFTFKIVTQNYF
jgi:YLP motif-containing protein 1